MLRLLRISIACTPVADVLAGYLSVREDVDAAHPVTVELILACLASVAVFCSAVSLNDLLDRKKDEKVAPERPIPSGAVSPRSALLISMAMGLLALFFGALAGLRILCAVAVVLLLTLLYNLVSRRNDWIGVLNLGVIRAADFYVGMTVLDVQAFDAGIWTPAPILSTGILLILYGLYAAGLSIIALAERSQKKLKLAVPASGLALLALAPVAGAWELGQVIPALILWAVLVLPMVRFFHGESKGAEHLVGHLVSGYFLFAALFALAADHPGYCAFLWIAYFISRWLSRTFPPA